MNYKIVSAKPGERLDVSPLLKFPQDFHGDMNVDHLVKFGPAFAGLTGRHDEALPKTGVMILEQHDGGAKKLMDQINALAQKIISDARFYDDPGIASEYFNMAKEGYRMLDKYEPKGIPVSLERAGLVTTRLALNLSQDAEIGNEVAVVTKRMHLKDEPAENLSVTVQWRDREKLKSIDGGELLLSDFVNPASGASGLAFVVAAKEMGYVPAQINHRSISCTSQGVNFVRQELDKLGIKSTFYSVGVCHEMNEMYYLIGDRAVADAGQVLRHFLPKWYTI